MYWYSPHTNSQMFKIGFTHTLSSNMYYGLSLYYNSYHYDDGDYDYHDLNPAYQRDENNEFYTLNYVSAYEENDQRTFGVKGDILWQANANNEIKAGFELRQHTLDRFYISSPYYDNHVLDDYKRNPHEAAAYIQDKINFSSIILSAGLRFDLHAPNADYWVTPFDIEQDITEAFKSSKSHTQLSPRLGISYPVTDKTVFHFGYGHYFQRPEYQFIYKTQADKNSPEVYDVDNDGDIDYEDNMLMNLRTGNGRFGDPDLKPEKTIAYEFGLSQQLPEDYIFKVSIYSKKITNLLGSRTFWAGDSLGWWESISLHINEDFAYNNGLEIQLLRKRGKYLTGEINYTYSVAEGSSSGPLERVGIEEANRQTLKFFPLDWDQRHTLNVNLTCLLGRFRTTLLYKYGSGLPYTKAMRSFTDPYELNNGRLPTNWTIDLKVDAKFKFFNTRLIPYLEIYNLTDRKNIVWVDPYTGKPDESYGYSYEYAADPRNWGSPRIIYFGVDIKL